MIEFLLTWQTLLGALTGGIFGLLAALIVAKDARIRLERCSAFLLQSDFTDVLSCKETLDIEATQEKVADENMNDWYANHLIYNHPKLSPLFDQSVYQVSDVNIYLTAHLSLFSKIYKGFLEDMKSLVDAKNALNMGERPKLSDDELKATIKNIYYSFNKSCSHAECASILIHKMIFSKARIFHKFYSKFIADEKNDICRKLLSTG